MQKLNDELIGQWFLSVLENDADGNITKLAKLLGTDYNDAYRMTMRFKDKAGSSRKAVDLLLGYHMRTGRSIDDIFLSSNQDKLPGCDYGGFIDDVCNNVNAYMDILGKENHLMSVALMTIMRALDELRKLFCLRFMQSGRGCRVCPYINGDDNCPCKMLASFLDWMRGFLISRTEGMYTGCNEIIE